MRRLLGSIAVGGLALVLSSQIACVKRKSGLSESEKEQLKPYILDDMPGDVPHKVEVNYGDKIHLIGWRSDSPTAAPGSTVHLTLYWRKTGDLEPGWMLFTHVTTDNTKEARGNLDCVGAIRVEKKENCTAQLYGPSDWDKGKVIVDSFEYTVPNDWTSPTVRFLVGIWRLPDTRLDIKNADANDGDNRANVVFLPTGVKPAEMQPPKTEVPKLNVPKFGKADTIKLDGKLDEPAWGKAAFTGPFVQPGDGNGALPDYPVNATAKLGWDDDNLYVAVQVADKDASSPFKPTDKDPHIWQKSSAVELMIQPGDLGDNKEYYEIQVDVNGALFDTHWDDYNVPKDDATQSFGHMDWSSGLKNGVNVQKGQGYTIEIALPWKSFVKPRVPAPPQPGQSWRANLYSFRDNQSAALAWSPILGKGNFHFAPRFGRLTFVDANGGGADGAAPSASASAALPLPPKLPTNGVGIMPLPKIAPGTMKAQ